ncbi:MAG: roadblock/LC7 domain-containing protein [Actinobacteria bacterium]|nr:roadblock/LC7 domain-containing protein [Actinomycetota bacterium]
MEPALTNLVISPEAMAGIEARLGKLVRDASATCALLLDHSGQIIGVSGDTDGRQLVSLGALLAGNFASAREIARLLKEPRFTVCLHQGEREHVLTSLVGDRCLLSVLFAVRGQLGLVKFLSARASDDLAVMVEAGRRQAMASGLDAKSFRQAAERSIDSWLRERDGGGLG